MSASQKLARMNLALDIENKQLRRALARLREIVWNHHEVCFRRRAGKSNFFS
jgi:hypothetical protein